jgi:hypothetical protein
VQFGSKSRDLTAFVPELVNRFRIDWICGQPNRSVHQSWYQTQRSKTVMTEYGTYLDRTSRYENQWHQSWTDFADTLQKVFSPK